MTTVIAIIIFIFGTAIGSFISVVIHRTHTKKGGIAFSQSICVSCKKPIKWRHLIPLFSWLYLRGKCAYCGKKISFHYFLLELFTGLLFLVTFLKWNFLQSFASTIDPTLFSYAIDYRIFEQFTYFIIIFTFLTAIFFYDLKYKEIPDRFSIPAIGIALAGGFIFSTPTILSMFIGGAAIFLFFLVQFLLSNGTWIGGGDLRLGFLMGILLGWEQGLMALIIAYILGAFISITLLIQGKVNRKTAIAFGPFLITGIIITVLVGDPLLEWYLNLLNF